MVDDPDGFLFKVWGVMAVVLAGCVVAYLVTQWRKRSVLRKLAGALRGRLRGNTLTASHHGTGFEIHYFERHAGVGQSDTFAQQTSQCGLRLSVACRSRGAFGVMSRTRGAWLLVAAEDLPEGWSVPSGDAEFDRDFEVPSETAAFTSAYFAAPEKRKAVRDVFALGFHVVRHDGEVLQATRFFPGGEPRDVSPSTFTRAVAHLAVLARDVPR